jgi:hypothetical protein
VKAILLTSPLCVDVPQCRAGNFLFPALLRTLGYKAIFDSLIFRKIEILAYFGQKASNLFNYIKENWLFV